MRFTRVLWVATLMATSPLGAQVAPAPGWPIAEGSRVRIRSLMLGDWGPTLGARYATGTVVSATADTLTFRADGDSAATAIIPTRGIFKMEIARGTHTNTKIGALIGFAAGLLAGAATADMMHKSCRDIGCPDGYYRPYDEKTGGLLGGLGGAIMGAWLGRRPTETWVPVVIPGR